MGKELKQPDLIVCSVEETSKPPHKATVRLACYGETPSEATSRALGCLTDLIAWARREGWEF